MIEYAGQEGGRYTYIDDILNLQNLALAFNSLLTGCGNFVISGCEVSGTSISEGYVYINGKIRFFSGAKNISSFPVYIYESNSVQNVAYVDSASKIGRNIYSCSCGVKIPTSNDPLTGKVPEAITITATSTVRLNDAFFGKYSLMVNSPRSMQTVEKPVTFNGKVLMNSGTELNGELKLNKDSSNCLVKYDENGNLVIQSQTPSATNYKFVISSNGEFRFYNSNVLCATINSTGIVLSDKSLSANTIQAGNVEISGSEIINKGAASNNGDISFNYTGYNKSDNYYRDFNIYDGKKGLVFCINGANKKANLNGSIELNTSDYESLIIKNASFAKTSSNLQNVICWKDSNYESISYVGYDSITDSVFRIKNNIGNIEAAPSEYFNVVGEIRENDVPLNQVYLTITESNKKLNEKANVANVYSKTDADNQFIALSGGISSLIDYMTSKGDTDAAGTIRTLIKVPSTSDTDKLYTRKDQYLKDIATDDNKKKNICENIGAAYKEDTQLKLKDTGWVQCPNWQNGLELFARQIGNIVCIQGSIGLKYAGIIFSIPNSIDAPAYDISWGITRGSFNWNGSMTGETRDFHYNNHTSAPSNMGINVTITITYMV